MRIGGYLLQERQWEQPGVGSACRHVIPVWTSSPPTRRSSIDAEITRTSTGRRGGGTGLLRRGDRVPLKLSQTAGARQQLYAYPIDCAGRSTWAGISADIDRRVEVQIVASKRAECGYRPAGDGAGLACFADSEAPAQAAFRHRPLPGRRPGTGRGSPMPGRDAGLVRGGDEQLSAIIDTPPTTCGPRHPRATAARHPATS